MQNVAEGVVRSIEETTNGTCKSIMIIVDGDNKMHAHGNFPKAQAEHVLKTMLKLIRQGKIEFK